MTSLAPLRLIALVSLALLGMFPVASSCAAAEAVSQMEVLDLDEAAALLRITPEVVLKMAEAQRIPVRRVGDVWRFSRTALLEWLQGGQVTGTSRASPAPPELTRVAQAAPDAKPQASGLPPAQVGERPAAMPTAEAIALRDQRVLLKRGAVTVELGTSYSRSEQTLLPIIRQEQRSVSANAALRYGLLNDLQATVRVPGVWRRTSIFTDARVSSTPSPSTTLDKYVGDASISLLGVALHEAVGRPNVIWSVDGVVPTGPGDRGLGGGLVLSKSYDPAVIFAGISYLYGFSVDAADSRRSLAKHNIGMSFGYTYAVNDSLALNTLFVGTYRNADSPDKVSIPPPSERYQLQLGMTWLLARGMFMEPAVAMRLGGESPDVTVSVSMNYSF